MSSVACRSCALESQASARNAFYIVDVDSGCALCMLFVTPLVLHRHRVDFA